MEERSHVSQHLEEFYQLLIRESTGSESFLWDTVSKESQYQEDGSRRLAVTAKKSRKKAAILKRKEKRKSLHIRSSAFVPVRWLQINWQSVKTFGRNRQTNIQSDTHGRNSEHLTKQIHSFTRSITPTQLITIRNRGWESQNEGLCIFM